MLLQRRQLRSRERQQEVQRFASATLPFEVVGSTSQQRGRPPGVASIVSRLRGGDLRVGISFLRRFDTNDRLRRPTVVTAKLTKLRQQPLVRLRIGKQPLPCGDLGQLPKRMLVITLGFERLLVQRHRPRKTAVAEQVVRNPDELDRGAVAIASTEVQIAKHID